MAKYIHNQVVLTELEEKAQEFIALSFAYCEEQLQLSKFVHPCMFMPQDTALANAMLSVQESMKTFLAVARIAGDRA